jgi:hypothetical protein
VIEIGDFSEKESMEYLDKRKIDKTEAKKLYELVGGRIVDLKSVADKIHKGQTFDGIFSFDILLLTNLHNFALNCFLQTLFFCSHQTKNLNKCRKQNENCEAS